MTRLAANLSMLFTDLPFLERFGAAAAAGFRAVEFVSPYAESAEAIAAEVQRHGLAVALFNFPPGDWAAGERGFAADPARVEEFRRSIDTALTYADRLDCPTLHVMAGKMPPGADRAAWTATLVDNLQAAADAAAGAGRTLVLEPINTRIDVPTYFYDRADDVVAVIEATGRPNVKLLFDIYHVQIMEGDVARSMERLMPRIGHVQIADNPGRHEPGTGELNYPWLFARLEALGYAGWIGCEYVPAAETVAGLGWAAPYMVA